MTTRARATLARVPGARSVARRARLVRERVARRQRRRRLAEVVRVVRSAVGTPDGALVVVLAPAAADLVEAIRVALPGSRVVEAPVDDAERHLSLTAIGPVDVIVDAGPEDGRRGRFEATFFQLRAGGTYVVPDGAAELGDEAGALGRLLAAAAQAPSEPVRSGPNSLPASRRQAIKNHVTHRAAGRHLLLTHDVSDVVVKMRDSEFNDYLRRVGSPHRVVTTIPADPPPAPPEGVEGPTPRTPAANRPITRAELSLRDYRDVIVAPKQVLRDGRVLLPDTYRHNQWPVLLHTQMVDLAERFARPRTALAADPPRLDGTYLHLDNEFRGHFGHLLTESLSRAWTWPHAVDLDPEARVLLGATSKRPRPLEYELALYEACGIPRDRIVVIDGPVRVERLISGSPMFSHPEFVHPAVADTWREVGDRLAASAPAREWPRRFFVGRRTDKRSCVNGEVVEAMFADRGFEIVYPEDYTLGEQVQLFRAAEVIGGYAGSGLFQIAFVPEPTHVIMVGALSYTPRNEHLMAAVHGHRIDSVMCRAEGRSIQKSYRFDAERDEPFLRGILDRLS